MIHKIILFTILSLSLFAEDDLEKISLQFHWKYQFEFAGFIAAKEKGFYKDVGLDVELKEFTFGQDVVKDVVNKKTTYGILDSYILVSYLQGAPLELIASFFKRSAMVLITQPEIKSFQDLNNKVIMGPQDLLKNILISQKVDFNSLHFKKHTFTLETFINHECDAMTAFISDQPFKLNEKGVKYNILDPSDYGVFNLQLELFTSEDEVKYHYKRVKKLRDASIKGWIYALEHKDEIIEIILKKYKSTLSREALEYEANEIEKLILPTVYEVGSIDKTFLLKQFELFKKQTSNIQNKNLNNYIFQDNIFHRKIDYTLVWKIISLFSFILLIILFYTLRNKKLQRIVEKERNKFKNIFEKSVDGMMMVQNNSFLDCNKAAVKIFGYASKEELLKMTPSIISPPFQENGISSIEYYNELLQTARQEGFADFEWIYCNTKKENLWIDVSITHLPLQDQMDLFFMTFRDITHKKELQKQILDLNTSLEKRVKDEVEKNRQKDQHIMQQSRLVQMGEMISMIAHQWRQPLNAISATAIAISIKAEMQILDNVTARESATKISDYAQHLSVTIDDFRDFFKPNKKQVTTSLNAIVESTLLIVKSSIISKNIELILELNAKEEFLTFKSELTQVLLNILQNAQDALTEIKIDNPFIKVKTYKENDQHIVEISDNGGGINSDIIEKIFDPYFSTKEKKNGTGLGLYMSKQIVEEHCNGKLLVENEADGVVFKIILSER